ncbi:MAG: MDR/zinc-dependent alcohol dehydrogenase-like family protein [Chitinivibrionales bacterium]
MRKPVGNEVRIRMQGCGICASNIPLWQGREWFEYPIAPGNPGHEGWGVVDALGAQVQNVKIGQRVSAISFNAFAQYDYAPEDSVVVLPSELDDKPFPGEPLACAINIYAKSKIKKGDTVAVIGVGFLGALLTQLASADGAEVIAISRRPTSLQTAQTCGAHHTVPMDDHFKIVDTVNSITSGRGCDCVIEAVGAQWPLDLAADITAEQGRLVIAGYHQDGLRHVNMQIWNWRAFDIVNAHVRDPRVYVDGMQKAVDAAMEQRIDPFSLITHEFSLDELAQGLNASIQRPQGYIKGVIKI